MGFEWMAEPAAWMGLATLIVLELVLGIDNLVFIAILADKLPPHQRDKARVIGLSLALALRLGLLAGIAWLVTLTRPLFSVGPFEFAGRDLTREPDTLPGRAMMQYEQNYAWMEGNQVVVLRPEKAPAFAHYDRAKKHLSAAEAPPADGDALARRALAHALLPAWLYREQRYRLPE